MADDELVFQTREVTGDEIEACDLCGRPAARSSLTAVVIRGTIPESGDARRVCARCLTTIERDDLPLEEESSAEPDDLEL